MARRTACDVRRRSPASGVRGAAAGQARELPSTPFEDLITAFEQDQTVTRYATSRSCSSIAAIPPIRWAGWCLGLCGYRDAERQALSDATCTALQLANFWQDVTVDLEKDRIYLPLEWLRRYGYSTSDLRARDFRPAFQEVMREAVSQARDLFLKGLPLVGMVDRRLALDLDLFSRGGLLVLEKIERMGYNVLAERPAISKTERIGLLLRSLCRIPFLRSACTPSLASSYEHCIRVARAKARNFYYSFLLLPKEKRQAMCAVYAFMRHCDDLSDEPGADRRVRRAGGVAGGDGACSGRGAGNYNALWPAFADTVERYRIPHAYFHAMIDGVSSDLFPRRVKTFNELYEYCYRVASVVGLTVIHIFEFEDAEALDLAEKCGIAFQLTNILRDMKEDAERGRVYLPAEDLTRFGVAESQFCERTTSAEARQLFRFEAARARSYYEESRRLVGMVGKESRKSLWALIEIYSELLRRIEKRDYEVLAERIRLSAAEKFWILIRALGTDLNARPFHLGDKDRTSG